MTAKDKGENMNIFMIYETKEPQELTRDIYMEHTDKSRPYYQFNKKLNKEQYFAICPKCGNTIQIINLLRNEFIEKGSGRTGIYGKHYKWHVDGMPQHNHIKYNLCPLHKPVVMGSIVVRTETEENDRMKLLILNNRKIICNDIRDIIGIWLKNDKIDILIDNFINQKHYSYSYVNEYNIPYCILFASHSIMCYKQKVSDNEMGENIKTAIDNNSSYFSIENNQIKKVVDGYAEINLMIYKHNIKENSVTLKIAEFMGIGKTHKQVYKEKIYIKERIYKQS